MALAAAKRAYDSLTAAERVEFTAYVEQASGAEQRVKLRSGTGKRARLNGQLATVVAKRGGGWVDVVVEAGGERITWRSGGWDPTVTEAPAVCDIFSLLPDALAVEVLALLSTPEAFHAVLASRALCDVSRRACVFGECSLRSGIPAGLGVRPYRQLDFARMLGAKHAQLRSMHVDFGSEELDVVRWLLQECDCTRLEMVTLRCHELRGQITLSRPNLPGTSSEPLDLSVRGAVQPLPAVGLDVRSSTRRSITGVLAQMCPALKVLKLPMGVDDTPSLTSIKSLCRLEATFLEVDDINFAVGELPCLTDLVLLDALHSFRGKLELESSSLKVIDLDHAAKTLTFKRIDCPNLREIRCREYSGYGNGLILAIPDGAGGYKPWAIGYNSARFQLPAWGGQALQRPPVAPSGLCTFAALKTNFSEVGDIVEVPSGCTVTWGSWSTIVVATRPWSYHLKNVSVTPTTTLAELTRHFETALDAEISNPTARWQ